MTNHKNKINILLKEADYADIDSINEIMRNSLSYWDFTPEQLNSVMDLFQIDEKYLLSNRIYLAYDESILFGFFSFVKNSDNEDELNCFYIRKDLIGSGYGKNMWEVCCKKASSLGMESFIIMSTPSADGFYEKMGAKKFGSRPSKIRKGVILPLLRFFLTTHP